MLGLLSNEHAYVTYLDDSAEACKARRVEAMWTSLCPCSAFFSEPSSKFISAVPESKSIKVRVYSLLWNYTMELQELRCSCCGAVGTPSSHDALCYASQAGPCQDGSFLFTRELLEYATRSLVHGSSILKLAKASDIPKGEVHQFGRAWFEYAKCVHLLDAHAMGILGIDTGPFSACPVCSLVFKDGKHDPELEAALQFPVCICTDASNTLDRLKCGAGVVGIVPTTSMFVGDSHRDITARLRSGNLTSSSYSVDTDSTYGCGPGRDYKAGRQKPTSTSKKGSEGLVGCVCKHVIPLVGAFASLDNTHECYLFYDVILDAIIAVRPDVTFVYLDFGCRFGRHYRLRDDARLTAAIRARVRFLVPWMHSQGHVIQCRLKDGGMYAEGAGYVVGEQTEQLWAVMKAWAASIRYMTAAHRIDFFNIALACVALQKSDFIFSYLASKEKQMIVEIASMDAKLHECLTAYVKAHPGITDIAAGEALLERAKALTAHQIAQAAPQPSGEDVYKLDYVLCRVRLNAVLTIVSDGGLRTKLLYPRVLDVQVALDAESSSAALAEAKHMPLFVSLGWLTPDGAQLDYPTLAALPTFVAAFSELRDAKMEKLDCDISVAVAKLQDYALRINARSLDQSRRDPLKERRARLENTITNGLIPSLRSWRAFDVARGIGAWEDLPALFIPQLLAGVAFPGLLRGGTSLGFTASDVTFRDSLARHTRAGEELLSNATEKIRARLSKENLCAQLTSKVQIQTASLARIGNSIRADLTSGNFPGARASWSHYRQVDGEVQILSHHLARVTKVLASAAGMGLVEGAPYASEGATEPDAESVGELDSDDEFLEAVDSDTDSESED